MCLSTLSGNKDLNFKPNDDYSSVYLTSCFIIKKNSKIDTIYVSDNFRAFCRYVDSSRVNTFVKEVAEIPLEFYTNYIPAKFKEKYYKDCYNECCGFKHGIKECKKDIEYSNNCETVALRITEKKK